MKIEIAEVPSPIGDIVVACHEGAVVALRFRDGDGEIAGLIGRRFQQWETDSGPNAAEAAGRLRVYFAGDLHALDGLPVDTGGTPFQRAVWAPLRRIPAGRTGLHHDMDGTVVFLGSDASAYVTGQLLFVDGGFSIGAMSALPKKK